jgi:hypothetical protein
LSERASTPAPVAIAAVIAAFSLLLGLFEFALAASHTGREIAHASGGAAEGVLQVVGLARMRRWGVIIVLLESVLALWNAGSAVLTAAASTPLIAWILWAVWGGLMPALLIPFWRRMSWNFP